MNLYVLAGFVELIQQVEVARNSFRKLFVRYRKKLYRLNESIYEPVIEILRNSISLLLALVRKSNKQVVQYYLFAIPDHIVENAVSHITYKI